MRIQHNIMAKNAYRSYSNNVSEMKKNLERLSSGYKINRAGDDAAGLAISEKMRAQITGLETAQKNAKDGISLVQTAEGALTEVHDMLNRMVELASMSANGTYDNSTDRAQLQKEIEQLKDEINRIADSANFNGIQLLDGSMDSTGKISLSGMKDVATATTAGVDANLGFATVTDGQLVSKAPAAGVYSIDFKDLELTNSSTGDIKVTFTLDANGKTAEITVKAGTTMKGEDVAAAIAEALRTANNTTEYVAANGIKLSTGGVSYDVYASGSKVYLEMIDIPSSDAQIALDQFKATFTGGVGGANGVAGSAVGTTTVASNAGNQFEVTPEVEPVSNTSRVFGQATFYLTQAAVQDGNALKIGNTTYVFAVGKDSKYTQAGGDSNVVIVDLTDQVLAAATTYLTAEQLKTAAQRLAKAAQGNSSFYVGSTVGSVTISLTEKEGGVDYSINNLAGADGKSTINGSTVAGDSKLTDWSGLVKLGKASMGITGSSLTLQIGDTAASYNQLTVNVADCHTAAIGVDGVDISTQEGAVAAVDIIRAAIDYVSDVRGTLGATQNRLEHTINNLSIMAENIQDSESTIRDTDVAAEMMEYTKNNILIQSAQAMLAQANQIPQGVLQLLQ